VLRDSWGTHLGTPGPAFFGKRVLLFLVGARLGLGPAPSRQLSLVSTEWFVCELLAHRSSEDQWEKANLDNDKSVEIRDALAEEVRSLS
jgi:hypothetical protein